MKLLLLNQAFYPDVVSTAQHAADLAKLLASHGHDVTVIANSRGYDNPGLRFPKRETWNGIKIIRVPSTHFGKTAKWRRALDFGSFLVGCLSRLIVLKKFDAVIAMTSPPLVCALATKFVRIRGGALLLWVMDLQPDLAIAAGWLNPASRIARQLTKLLIESCQQAQSIIALDKYMKERIAEKGIAESKIAVVPPWSHDESVRFDEEGREAFRAQHKLTGKFVVMYSGNHSPCHPLTTILDAARQLKDDSRIAFCFVGGGSEHKTIQERSRSERLTNVLCLPYQPLHKLSASLSSADLHVVAMGNPFVGIVHPCKVYNILSLGIPIQYLGPCPSHLVDMLPASAAGKWASIANHGDVEAVVNGILERVKQGGTNRNEAAIQLAKQFSANVLLPKMLNLIDSAVSARNVGARTPDIIETQIKQAV